MISTPLRLLGLVRASKIDLSSVQLVILDEADKLFEIDTKSNSNSGRNSDANNQDNSDDDGDNNSEESDSNSNNIKRDRSSFLTQVDEILAACPVEVDQNNSDRNGNNGEKKKKKKKKDTINLQKALFSATISPFVKELAEAFLKNPINIFVGKDNTAAITIEQQLIFVGREDGKITSFRQIIQKGKFNCLFRMQ